MRGREFKIFNAKFKMKREEAGSLSSAIVVEESWFDDRITQSSKGTKLG